MVWQKIQNSRIIIEVIPGISTPSVTHECQATSRPVGGHIGWLVGGHFGWLVGGHFGGLVRGHIGGLVCGHISGLVRGHIGWHVRRQIGWHIGGLVRGLFAETVD